MFGVSASLIQLGVPKGKIMEARDTGRVNAAEARG